MLKLDQEYSDYTDMTDENYPAGKAVNASTSESFDGTPLLASFMNNIIGAMQAMFKKAHGSIDGISGVEDNVNNSQFADAVAKYSDDRLKNHADKRGLNAHGATVEAEPGQIATRDNYGNLQVGDALEDADAVNLQTLNNVIDPIQTELGKLGSSATKTAGSAAGNVPLVGTALGTTNNNIVTTDASGNLKPSGITIGSAAGKTAGSASGNVPLNGAALGTTDNNVVVTNASGNLKPAGITYGNMMSASNAGALCSTAKGTQAKTVTLTGFTLYSGVTVKVMFTNGNSAANPTLNVNGTGAKAIKVVNNGSKIVPINHTGYWGGATTTSVEMWQSYTILEFMYDGTDWVIVGNPTVESWHNDTSGYEVKANGLIEQWKIESSINITGLLLIKYNSRNYIVRSQMCKTSNDGGNNGYFGTKVYIINESSFKSWGNSQGDETRWTAIGY